MLTYVVDCVWYLCFKELDQMWGPPSLLFSGYTNSYSGVKRPERDVNDSRASSAEGKNEWSRISPYPMCLRGVNKEKVTFTLLFYLCIHHNHHNNNNNNNNNNNLPLTVARIMPFGPISRLRNGRIVLFLVFQILVFFIIIIIIIIIIYCNWVFTRWQ
jgi:hypothetical protein